MNCNSIKLFICIFLLIALPVCTVFPLGLGDVEIEELPCFKSNNTEGVVNYRFIVTNNTKDRINAELKLCHENYRSDNNAVTIKKKIELQPNGSQEESIPCPKSLAFTSRVCLSVWSDNTCLCEKEFTETVNFFRGNKKQVLLDREISHNELDKFINIRKKIGNRTNRRGLQANTQRAVVDTVGSSIDKNYYENNLELMDTNWLAYTPFAALIFYDHSLNRMPRAVNEAIYNYVRAGGVLVVLGADYNNDKIDFSFNSNTSEDILGIYDVDFGKIIVCRKDLLKFLPKWNNIDKILKEINFAGSPFGSEHNEIELKEDYSSKVIAQYFDNENMICFFAVLVVVMTVVLGPLNFWILWRKNKRIMVYITTPALALGFCSCIGLYYMIFEYNRLNILRNSITFLNETDSSAVTYGAISLFSGQSRRGALSFPAATALYFNRDKIGFNKTNANRTILLSNKINLEKNWIKARIPFCVSGSFIQRTRARVEIRKKGDSELDLLNGLGADIDKIFVRLNDENKVYSCSSIGAGKIGKATAFALNFPNNKEWQNCRYIDERVRGGDGKVGENLFSEKMLKPGEYLAYLKSDPFMAQEIDKSAEIQELGCIVVGKIGNGAAK